jgi:hypothetical protein
VLTSAVWLIYYRTIGGMIVEKNDIDDIVIECFTERKRHWYQGKTGRDGSS